jgi:hydroxyacylglutathione hydrolase
MEIKPITLHYFFGVNSYLIETETGYFLIDTGIKKKRDQLEREIQEAGCRPGDLKLIIITHGHIDHVGNATYLRDRYEAKIAMHRGDSGMVESGDMFVDTRGGVMIGLVGALMKILGLSDYERFTPDIYLEDGQDLSTYGLDAAVIHTPGHSEGSICIHTAEGDLFCGDLFNNTKKPEKASLIQDPDKLEASVEKLRALEIKTVYPGHGKPFRMEQLTE